MDINRILQEYAKLHLQLVQANDVIAALQAQIKNMQMPPAVPPAPPTQ